MPKGGCRRYAWHLLVALVVPVVPSLRFAEHRESRVASGLLQKVGQQVPITGWEGVPPPENVMDTLRTALAVRDKMKRTQGYAGLIPPILANEVGQLAANRFGCYPPWKCRQQKSSSPAGTSSPIVQASTPSMPGGKESPHVPCKESSRNRWDPLSQADRKVPKPPACPAPLPELTHNGLGLELAPYKPTDRTCEQAIKLKDGGLAWPLTSGGWYFQYPDMILRMRKDGATSIRWTNPPYAVDYDANGIVYYTGRSKVHRTVNNDVLYQDPSGTVRQEGNSLIYHWCEPNAIVFQSPFGTAYYDDGGVTFRSSTGTDVSHYAATGEVLYQGVGGITSHETSGNVTHWTREGAIYQHANGEVTYTPVGETRSRTLETGELGPDPFPGKPLTANDMPSLNMEGTELSKKLKAALAEAFTR